MVHPHETTAGEIDLSFMPTLRCNLHCTWCMYDCGPDRDERLSLGMVEVFAEGVPWEKVRAIGLYGGEATLELLLCERILDVVPRKPTFLVTNGTWSTSEERTAAVREFAADYDVEVWISGTPQHRPHQDRDAVRHLCTREPDVFHQKHDWHDDYDENGLPMGRSRAERTCTFRCLDTGEPLRFALTPQGKVVFQRCDGIYPVVGDYTDKLSEIVAGDPPYGVCEMKPRSS